MSVLSACCAYCETKNDRICFRFARTVRAIILTVRFANREIGTGSCDGEGQTVMRGSHGAEVSPETAEKRMDRSDVRLYVVFFSVVSVSSVPGDRQAVLTAEWRTYVQIL